MILDNEYIERNRSILGKSSIKNFYKMWKEFHKEDTTWDDQCWCDRRDIKKFKVLFLDWYDNKYNK